MRWPLFVGGVRDYAPDIMGVLTRLGNVLYWISCGIAILLVLYGVYGLVVNIPQDNIKGGLAFAFWWSLLGAVVWLIGLVSRYIFDRE